ncbi:MAG TPA: transcription termination/antitermination NusG family protein [Chthoniobacteraceae bacterium]|jgi:transcriptional antiterminator RfaH
MILSPAQICSATEPLWFCLRTKPKHEHLAAAGLRQLENVRCFCPRIRYRRATRRGPVWFVQGLFPGYIFAQFEYAARHRQVQHASGIMTILRFGDGVAAIDDPTIERLRALSGTEELIVFDPQLKVGDEVRIATGVLEGLQAVVTQLLPAKERVKVLLEFLGRPVVAEVSAPKLISPTPPRLNLK